MRALVILSLFFLYTQVKANQGACQRRAVEAANLMKQFNYGGFGSMINFKSITSLGKLSNVHDAFADQASVNTYLVDYVMGKQQIPEARYIIRIRNLKKGPRNERIQECQIISIDSV